MTLSDLNNFLFKETQSEKRHKKEGRDVLSKKYNFIPQINLNGKTVYQFQYNSILGASNIAINKESRWTYIPDHIHTVIEMIYVYHGHCTQKIKEKEVRMSQGDLCILDQNVLHSIGYLNKDDIIISIEMRKEYFSENLLSQLAEDSIISTFLANAISMSTEHNNYLLFRNINKTAQDNINNILSEYFDKTLCSDQIINANILLLMCQLMRQFRGIQKQNYKNNKLDIEKVLNYIDKNYQTVTLKSTAQYFGFHPNYLSTLIKKETGKTFKQLVLNKRFKIICFLLISTDKPIYEISEEAGYNNLGFFYKKFEEIYKISPKEYREKKNLNI